MLVAGEIIVALLALGELSLKERLGRLLPAFGTRDALRKSVGWQAYFAGLYGDGDLPEDAFPLDTSKLWLLHLDIPDTAAIADPLKALTIQPPGCPREEGEPYARFSRDHDAVDTVSVYRVGPFEPLPDQALVEVTHCSDREARANEAYANWMYRADGSGIWFNVGRTLAVGTHPELVARVLPAQSCPDDECVSLFGAAFAAAAKEGYDSVQFLRHADQRCSASQGSQPGGKSLAHEIVDLRGDGRFACGTEDARLTKYRAGWRGSKACECTNELPCANCALLRKRSLGQLLMERALDALERALGMDAPRRRTGRRQDAM